MRLIVIIIIFVCATSFSLIAQDVDFEAFKGEPVELFFRQKFKRLIVKRYNAPNLSEQRKRRIRTVDEPSGFEYAPTPFVLLAKLYHAKSKQDVIEYSESESLANKIKLQKKRDYEQSHFLLEYHVSYRLPESIMAVVRYSEIENGKKIKTSTIQARNVGFDGYRITNLPELEPIEYILKALPWNAFIQFYQVQDSEDAEINKLRSLMRSSENRLNFDKFAKILKRTQKENPALWKKLQSL